MRIKETKLYTYGELSDEAKERARDWWREASAGDTYWSEFVTESFHEELAALGFTVDKKRGLQWSGFWSQGDGAGFTGTWRASDFNPAALLADRPPTHPNKGKIVPEHVELHRIAAELELCEGNGLLSASLASSHRGHFMSLDSAEHDDADAVIETQAAREAYADYCQATEARFLEAARDLAHAFYKALEAEHTYQNSDEQVAEAIEANGYEFTEEGERA